MSVITAPVVPTDPLGTMGGGDGLAAILNALDTAIDTSEPEITPDKITITEGTTVTNSLNFGDDVAIWRTDVAKFQTDSELTIDQLLIINGDGGTSTNLRFFNGLYKMEWGDSAGTYDTNLYRESANVLKTDDDFRVGTAGTDDESVATLVGTQTLTNKTLTSPVINSPTGDVVTLTGTQTLTNKTFGAGNVGINTSGMYRNPLLNSNFDIWQRGTSQVFASSGSSQVAYLADNNKDFVIPDGGTSAIVNISREAHTPGQEDGSTYYHSVELTGAMTSPGVNATILTRRYIEDGVRKLCGDGKSITVKFRLRASVNGTVVGINAGQNYGTGGSPSSAEVLTGTTFTLTTSFAEYEHTFTTNTLSGKTFGTDENSSIFQLDLRYMWGATAGVAVGDANLHNPGAVTIDTDWIQVNTGVTSLPYNPPLVADEQARCERYYQLITYGHRSHMAGGSQIHGSSMGYKTHMRKAPSATIISAGSSSNASVSIDSVRADGFRLSVTSSSSGDSYVINGTLGLSAEY